MLTDSSLIIDEAFQSQMDHHLKDAAKRRTTSTNPVALNKRMRQLERELQQERTKRAKVDLGTSSDSDTSSSSEPALTIDPLQALKDQVLTLKADRKLANFPSQCLSALPHLSRLVDANASPSQRKSFGLALSSADGKDLIRVLYLCALAKRVQNPDKGTSCSSWFAFVDRQKKHNPVLKAVNMSNWQSYRSTVFE